MALQACDTKDKEASAARARRERRQRHEARLRLVLVRDGARLAGHRGGPVQSPAELAPLRSELAALREELATLKAALAEMQVPVPMSQEEEVHIPRVKPADSRPLATEEVEVQPATLTQEEIVLVPKVMQQTQGSQYIELKAKDQEGRVMPCSLNKTSTMRGMMKAYCTHLGFQTSQVRHGQRRAHFCR